MLTLTINQAYEEALKKGDSTRTDMQNCYPENAEKPIKYQQSLGNSIEEKAQIPARNKYCE